MQRLIRSVLWRLLPIQSQTLSPALDQEVVFPSALWFYCVSNSFLTNFRGIYFSRKVFISFKIMLPEVNLKNLMSTSSRSVVWAPLLNFMYFFLIFFDWSLWVYQFSILKTSKLKTNKSMAYKSMANSTPTLCWDEDNHLNFIFSFLWNWHSDVDLTRLS